MYFCTNLVGTLKTTKLYDRTGGHGDGRRDRTHRDLTRRSFSPPAGPYPIDNKLVANNTLGNELVGFMGGEMPGLRKAGANWVDGERFFDRETDLAVLRDRVRNGTHTLLTAQRRIGKTSLVRELLRRLNDEGNFETVFVDLEAADSAADAIAEIGSQSRHVQGAWHRITAGFSNVVSGVGLEELSIHEVRVKLRAGVDAGSWRQKGDEICAALAENERAVVLAIDELPILVNRMLKDQDYRITSTGRKEADAFLSWLRRNGQEYRDKICLIVSGSVGLEPILRQADLSAHANIFSSMELRPWDEETALGCLAALAENCNLDLPLTVRQDMCRRLRCLVPHHIQRFFASLDEDLRREGRRQATLLDVERVYKREMLGARGQVDLDHYENRLKMVLGPDGYRNALDLLTEAAVHDGVLQRVAIARYHELARARPPVDSLPIDDILLVLEHDGYLEPQRDDYHFVSGLLEDWWRARHGQHFIPVQRRAVQHGA